MACCDLTFFRILHIPAFVIIRGKPNHQKMVRGGSAMSIVAYGAVSKSGLSFEAQLVRQPGFAFILMTLTDAVHAESSLVCVQLIHDGYFSDRQLSETFK